MSSQPMPILALAAALLRSTIQESQVDEIPEDDGQQNRPRVPKPIQVISNNACIRIPITWALAIAVAIGAAYLILIPTEFLPDYLALPIAFTLGMVLWGFLVGSPKNETRRLWTFSALLWGAAVCLVYADAFRQRHHVLIGWYWIGVGLQLLTAMLGIVYYLTDKVKKRKSQ